LLYTQVRNVSNSTYTHFSNSALNGKKVENISRSLAMQEVIMLGVNYDTPPEDIDTLREEMLKFLVANGRDFYTDSTDLTVEIVGFAMDKLDVKVSVKYKGNWADGKRMARRALVLRELLRLTKLIPINGPGGGGASLGSSDNPSFGVSLSADDAKANHEKWQHSKESARYKKTV